MGGGDQLKVCIISCVLLSHLYLYWLTVKAAIMVLCQIWKCSIGAETRHAVAVVVRQREKNVHTYNVITLSVCTSASLNPSIIHHRSSFSQGHRDSYRTRQAFHRRFVHHVSCMPSPAAETLDYETLQAAAAKLHSFHEDWRQHLKLFIYFSV